MECDNCHVTIEEGSTLFRIFSYLVSKEDEYFKEVFADELLISSFCSMNCIKAEYNESDSVRQV